MRKLNLGVFLLGAMALISGCAPTISSTDFERGAASQSGSVGAWALADVVIDIPESMPVDNVGNVRVPPDNMLVWFGDPPGDRKAQVKALLRDAVIAGAADALSGGRPIVFRLNVDQFHALTPVARATNIQLGVHSMQFDFQVLDASTGEVLASEDDVTADLRAFSGTQATLAEQAGQGQKIRIQTRVSQVVRQWLQS